MKKTLDNQYYFKISQKNPEDILDEFYIFDEKHPDIKKYINNTKEIKNVLITIRTLQRHKQDKKTIENCFLKLSGILGKFSNCSEFSCFINACDSYLALAKEDVNLLKKIVQKYLKKRIINESVPEEWVQAILDSNSGRKKGKSGERKLLTILKRNGFQEVKNWKDFSNSYRCVSRFSKIFNVKNVRTHLKIKISTKKQNKNLDLLIKIGQRIFLCEAKHLNTSGGAQDKQISELIEIISLKEKEKNISYVSFLDGSYSNIILNNNECGGKLKTQREEIKKYLSKNPFNFWVNTAGFKALFSK
jgi:hypothetical protein